MTVTNPTGPELLEATLHPQSGVGLPDHAGPASTTRTVFDWSSNERGTARAPEVGIEYDGHRLLLISTHQERHRERRIDRVLLLEYSESPSADSLAGRLRSLALRSCPEVHLVLATPRAVVRNFILPPVSPRQREAAALWQGQKLIPFPLQDGEALWGFSFAFAGERGWRTTLVALPSDDATRALSAIERAGWVVRSVSLAGTQCADVEPETPRTDEAYAVVSWSPARGSFAVHHQDQLVFHYDLGPMPATPTGLHRGASAEIAPIWQRWTDSLGVAVADALDFHLNVNPTIPPVSLRLYGLPAATAPLLTEWQTRFPAGVIVGDPLSGLRSGLPDGVESWLTDSGGLVAPVLAALRGEISVDLTPPRVRKVRSLRRYEQIARSAAMLSLVSCFAWTGLLWSEQSSQRVQLRQSEAELAYLENSPVMAELGAATAGISRQSQLLTAVTEHRGEWMPWMKTIMGTLPGNATLSHADAEYRKEHPGPIVHLEGILFPSDLAYAVTYRDWFDRLKPLCGAKGPVLVSERTLDVLGAKQSAFTIEVLGPPSLLTGVRP